MTANLVLPLLFLGVVGHTSVAMAQSMGKFIPTGKLTRPRQFHTATLLTNGKVLIAGGWAIASGWRRCYISARPRDSRI